MSVGRFEGVEEALARIGGNTWLVDAVRRMTAGAIDLGEKPSVVSAIAKYHVTERARQIVNDGMDVIGGKGICLGPSNFLGRAYQQIPIGITVEGANILTRSLILFGQGAIRCHPFVLREMHAAKNPDVATGFVDFDRALFAHVGFTIGNGARAFFGGLTGARQFSAPPGAAAETRRYYQQLTRFSAAFAFLADVSMLTLGGALKRREKLSARLGDILAMLYLASTALKRYEDDGRPAADAPFMHWAVQDSLYRAQQAFDGVLANFPGSAMRKTLRRVLFPLGPACSAPADRIGRAIAKAMIEPSATRDRLTAEVHLPPNEHEPVGTLEAALSATIDAEPIDAKIRTAMKSGVLNGNPDANVRDLANAAFAAGLVTAAEHALLRRRDQLRDVVIHVDDFPFDYGTEQQHPALQRAAA
jgi:acyl-CoA dehydrogenase